jgi:hypothetical protein
MREYYIEFILNESLICYKLIFRRRNNIFRVTDGRTIFLLNLP